MNNERKLPKSERRRLINRVYQCIAAVITSVALATLATAHVDAYPAIYIWVCRFVAGAAFTWGGICWVKVMMSTEVEAFEVSNVARKDEPIDWDKVAWRRLEKGEEIRVGDYVDACRDNWRGNAKWIPVKKAPPGTTASDPDYPAHNQYRRILQVSDNPLEIVDNSRGDNAHLRKCIEVLIGPDGVISGGRYPSWTSVKDGLPKAVKGRHRRVLCLTACGSHWIGRLWDEDTEFHDGECMVIENVTHWMPLTLPEGVEEQS